MDVIETRTLEAVKRKPILVAVGSVNHVSFWKSNCNGMCIGRSS